jgi:hypothetical protein
MPKSFELKVGSEEVEEIVAHFHDGSALVISSPQDLKLVYDEATDRTSTYRGDKLTGVYQGCPKAARIRCQKQEESEAPKVFPLIVSFLAGVLLTIGVVAFLLR